eukprot:c37098_g1_i1 orf=104-397(+)
MKKILGKIPETVNMSFGRSLICTYLFWFHVSLPILLLVSVNTCGCYATNLNLITTVKVGAIVDFKSAMGKAAKQTIQLAVRDVNRYRMNGLKEWKIE